MKRTYYLITNVSGFTYWSYYLDRSRDPHYRRMIAKYGPLYVNRNGGFMTLDCVKTILKTVTQRDFPEDPIWA